MTKEFKLPELGENIEYGEVVNVLVAEGEEVAPGQNVLELETEKAVVPVPCPHGGRVSKVHVKKGEKVKVGSAILTLAGGADGRGTKGAAAAPEKQEAKAAPAKTAAPEKTRAPAPDAAAAPKRSPAARAPAAAEAPAAEGEGAPAAEAAPAAQRPPAAKAAKSAAAKTAARKAEGEAETPVPAGPATRRLARQLGVDLDQVRGTAPGGRITPDDVKAHARSMITDGGAAAVSAAVGARAAGLDGAAPPLPDFSQFGEVERQPLSGVRRKTAEAMSLSWRLVPQVTHFDAADITDLEGLRRRFEERRAAEARTAPKGAAGEAGGARGAKITVTAFALRACAAALKAFPRVNSSIDPERNEIVFKRYVHIGVAVDTEHGLLVPVVRDVDRKTIPGLAAELQETAARARERRLDLAALRGASFTISNLGGIGGTNFTPIVNWPEVAILGISRAREESVVRGGKAEVRLLLPLALSYDHRAVDGAEAARFLRRVAALLSDPFELLLET